MATNGNAAETSSIPPSLRMVILSGNNDGGEVDIYSQKKKFFEQLAKDKTDVIVRTVNFGHTQGQLKRGCVVVAEAKTLADGIKILRNNKRDFILGALVKFGNDEQAAEADLALFSKKYTVKNESEIPNVVAQIREELFGKNAQPIIVKPLTPPKIVRGQFTGELSADDLRKAFESFGKVESFKSTSATSCSVTFEDAAAGAKAVEKSEISVNGVAVKITRGRTSTPRKAGNGQQQQKSGTVAAKKTDGNAKKGSPTSSYLKIENVPDELDIQTLKQTFQTYDERIVVDLNTQKHHVILKTSLPEALQKISKAKITVKGIELKAVPYTPRGAAPKKSQVAASGSVKAAPTTPSTPAAFRIVVEGADREKCTKEQLEKLFGGFKGLKRISRSRDQKLVFVNYDNAEAPKEILSAKEISCAGCKLTIRPFEERARTQQAPKMQSKVAAPAGSAGPSKKRERNTRGERKPRVPRENVLIIRELPNDIDVADLAPLFQSFDAAVNVRINKKNFHCLCGIFVSGNL